MPTPLPDGWPDPSPSQRPPVVYADMGDTYGPRAVGSFSLTRELVSAALSGNIRERSGFSVGDASVTVPRRGRTPWQSLNDGVIPPANRPVDLFASYDLEQLGTDDAHKVQLGSWIVAPVSGQVTTADMTVELDEAMAATTLKLAGGQPTAAIAGAGANVLVSPTWVAARLANSMNYYASTPNCPVPFDGGVLSSEAFVWPISSVGGSIATSQETYDKATGAIGLAGDATNPKVVYSTDVAMPDSSDPSSLPAHLFANVAGTVVFTVGGHILTVDGSAHTIRYDSDAPTSYPAGADPDVPSRIQIMIDEQSASVWLLKIRTGPDQAWTDVDLSGSFDNTTDLNQLGVQVVGPGSGVSGVCYVNDLDPGDDYWVPPNADLDYIDGRVRPFVPAADSPWLALQALCDSWQAATMITADKRMLLRNRDYLGGGAPAIATIDVGRKAEDLPWSIDPADTADRLEVTYYPLTASKKADDGFKPIVWQSSDVIAVPAHSTLQVAVVPTGPHSPDVFSLPWVAASNTLNLGTGHTFAWNSAVDGTGTDLTATIVSQVGSPSLGVSAEAIYVGDTRYGAGWAGGYTLNLINPTGSTIYAVDANGQACLIVRASTLYTQDTATVVARGADAGQNTMEVDLGQWVQTEADAEAYADWLWDRVRGSMWKLSSVNVALDLALDLGDVVDLAHGRTSLDAKALIVKGDLEGQAGSITQALDFVILPFTVADEDALWAGKTVADFDSLWSGSTVTDFDNDPKRVPA